MMQYNSWYAPRMTNNWKKGNDHIEVFLMWKQSVYQLYAHGSVAFDESSDTLQRNYYCHASISCVKWRRRSLEQYFHNNEDFQCIQMPQYNHRYSIAYSVEFEQPQHKQRHYSGDSMLKLKNVQNCQVKLVSHYRHYFIVVVVLVISLEAVYHIANSVEFEYFRSYYKYNVDSCKCVVDTDFVVCASLHRH